MGALIALIFVFAFAIVLAMARGFVLSYLWSWFLTPFGLPEIGIAHAMGISLLVAFLTYHYVERTSEEALTALVVDVAHCAIALSVGWVLLQVMY